MDETTADSRPQRPPRAQGGERRNLWFGLVLLAVGALLLADNLGVDLPFRLWEAWPLVIVALGGARLLWAADADERRGGFWTLTAGLYCWISSWRLFGLEWTTAWPIFLVAQGIVILFADAFDREHRRGKERDDAR